MIGYPGTSSTSCLHDLMTGLGHDMLASWVGRMSEDELLQVEWGEPRVSYIDS